MLCAVMVVNELYVVCALVSVVRIPYATNIAATNCWDASMMGGIYCTINISL